MKNSKRQYSLLELLRIVFLSFLIVTHFFSFSKNQYVDLQILRNLSFVSVSGFAVITGMFVFTKRSLLFRNVSRLIFIIIFSFVIGGFMSISGEFSFNNYLDTIASGSPNIWYIYAILPVYFLGPKLFRYMRKTNSLKLFLISLIPFAIGIFGWWKEDINGYNIFYWAEFGLLFSIPYLFALAMWGYLLKRFIESNVRHKNLIFITVFTITTVTMELLEFYVSGFRVGHGNPLTIVTAMSLVGLGANIKWYSKWVNWLAKRLYFVYEYHWYWIILYGIIFKDFNSDHPYAQFLVGWIVIFGFASFISIIITEIQIRVWIKYIDPQMLKVISWTKSKLVKPKVIN